MEDRVSISTGEEFMGERIVGAPERAPEGWVAVAISDMMIRAWMAAGRIAGDYEITIAEISPGIL